MVSDEGKRGELFIAYYMDEKTHALTVFIMSSCPCLHVTQKTTHPPPTLSHVAIHCRHDLSYL